MVSGLFALIIMVCGVLLTMQHYTSLSEYAYNGRVLDINQRIVSSRSFDVAGDHMSSNNNGARIKFIAGNNVLFRRFQQQKRI